MRNARIDSSGASRIVRGIPRRKEKQLETIETNSFGEYLSALRAVHKIKIYKLAGMADVDPVTIRHIEHGRKEATSQQRERLLNAIRTLQKKGQ
jgi:hypothetical protein